MNQCPTGKILKSLINGSFQSYGYFHLHKVGHFVTSVSVSVRQVLPLRAIKGTPYESVPYGKDFKKPFLK